MLPILLLTFILLGVARAQEQGMFSIPDNCADRDCQYKMMWKSLPGGMVEFTVVAKVDMGMWAGVGFSPSGGMVGSDAVVGWMSASKGFMLTDRYLRAKSPDSVPVDANQGDVMLTHSEYTDGMLKYTFKRPIIPGDTKTDRSLADSIYLIYAFGGTANDDKTITPHTSQGNIGRQVDFENLPPMAPSSPMDGKMSPEEKMPSSPDAMPMSPGGGGGKPAQSRSLQNHQFFDSCDKMPACPMNAHCVVEHNIARCYCKPEYEVDKYGNCGARSGMAPDTMPPSMGPPSMKPPMPGITSDKCKLVTCPANAKCRDGRCFCMAGYKAMDKMCKKSPMPKTCNHVKCPKYATCRTGACYCMKGYVRHGNMCKSTKSKAPTDKCGNVKCPTNAHCKDGRCFCMPSYGRHSDGTCKVLSSMGQRCGNKRCYKNAECRMGKCYCKTGFVQHSASCVKWASVQGCSSMNCGQGKCVIRDGQAGCSFSSRPHPNPPSHSAPTHSDGPCTYMCGYRDHQRGCSCSHTCLRNGGCCPDYDQSCGKRFNHLFDGSQHGPHGHHGSHGPHGQHRSHGQTYW